MLRYRSAFLSLEGLPAEKVTVADPPALRLEILKGLLSIGVEQEAIEGIECQSKQRWYIVFYQPRVRNNYIGQLVEIYETRLQLTHPNPPKPKKPQLIHVKIYNYPLDSSTDFLKRALKYYGPISYVNDLIDKQCQVKTGIRDVAFEKLDHEIPSYVYIGKHQVRCTYDGQTKTCRRCHKEGHIARDCTAGKVCQVCGEADHTRANCPNRRCYHCNEIGHVELDCPKYLNEFPDLNPNNHEDNPVWPPPSVGEWGADDWGANPDVDNKETDDPSKKADDTDKGTLPSETEQSSYSDSDFGELPTGDKSQTNNKIVTDQITSEKLETSNLDNSNITITKDPNLNTQTNTENIENQPSKEPTGERSPNDIKKDLFKTPLPREKREKRKVKRKQTNSDNGDESSCSDQRPMNTDDERETQRGQKRNRESPKKKDPPKRSRIPVSAGKSRLPFNLQTPK